MADEVATTRAVLRIVTMSALITGEGLSILAAYNYYGAGAASRWTEGDFRNKAN